MVEKVPGWLERVLLPEISEVKGELKAINGRIDGEFKAVHSEMEAMDARMDSEFRGVHSEIRGVEERLGTKVDELDKRMSTKIDELDKRMDMTQRLAVVEEQLKELRTRA